MTRRTYKLDAATTAVSWTISEADGFNVKALTLKFDAAPTTSENITLTIDSAHGAGFDTVIRTLDPSVTSATDVIFEDIEVFANGDALTVTYTNTDGNSIACTAVTEI